MRSDLERDGFAIVRGVADPTEVAAMEAAFDDLVAIARTLPGETDWSGSRFVLTADPFRLRRVVWCGGASPTLAAWGHDPRILGLAADALDSPDLVQLIQQAHVKLPGDEVDFDWHQDASNRRWGTDQWTDVNGRGSFVQIALAVDPMGPDNGGLRMMPGTHRLGFVADLRTGVVAPHHLAGTVVDVVLDPGDAVVFGPFVIHGSGPNQGTIPRRLFLQGYALPGANHRVYPGCGLGVARHAQASRGRAG